MPSESTNVLHTSSLRQKDAPATFALHSEGNLVLDLMQTYFAARRAAEVRYSHSTHCPPQTSSHGIPFVHVEGRFEQVESLSRSVATSISLLSDIVPSIKSIIAVAASASNAVASFVVAEIELAQAVRRTTRHTRIGLPA
jgi:hypothetical protein